MVKFLAKIYTEVNFVNKISTIITINTGNQEIDKDTHYCCFCSTNSVLEFPKRLRQGGKKARYRGLKRKTTEWSLFTHDMTTYMENSKENTKTFLELIREFNNMAEYENKYTKIKCIYIYQQQTI